MIDAHVHVWQLGRNGCGWPDDAPALAAIYRDFLPQDWRALASPLGVRQAILVQSQPHLVDTRFLLDLARQDDDIIGVVGWADLSGEQGAGQVAQLAQDQGLCGLRTMLQDVAASQWAASLPGDDALAQMVRHGLSLDALVRPHQLADLASFKARHDDLVVVLDHAGKPDGSQRQLAGWAQDLAKLAALPNTYCKLSGLVTEMPSGGLDADGRDGWAQRLQAIVDQLLETFGPQRLIWGSDWPVVELACSYGQWLTLTRNALNGLSAQDWDDVSSHNARIAYARIGQAKEVRR